MITVLLAVYNGEHYLKEQINSLISQTYQNFKIAIRDDGSTDTSPDIIDYYCEKYPQKIFKITGEPTKSAKLNFAELYRNVDDDYIMFCDQDDVWLPDKIEKTLAAMQKAEGEGNKTPVLVHSDLKVVNQNLEIISPSFFEFQQLKQECVDLQHLLVQNYITGCTVMVNRALKQMCSQIPPQCIMHDWWLALTAALFGKIVCLNQPTMLYRQHAGNHVGAKASYGIALIKRKLATLSQVQENYNATYTQANALLECYGEQLSDLQYQIIRSYRDMQNASKFKKIKTINKYGFKKCTRLRILGQYFLA